ncbi:MAG: reverse transcriptase/maturase family protein [Eubacteriales bacterium]|nr:reverse transcriptase/maturase family protein [Eubacteriales bacterium]
MLEFTRDLEEHLVAIQNELIWRTYRVGQYREFFVHEPKRRLVMALPFRDRVVQWALYRILNPLLERRYITDSYACRVGYGTHRAADRLQYWLRHLSRKHPKLYVLKLDISKYFYRVDHGVLLGILDRIIKDRDLMWLLELIIRSENAKFGLALGDHFFERGRIEDIGMPIGNLSSQMFANLYLNELDQHVKHGLRVRHYIRYMDDAIILHPDKRYLWLLKEEIEGFVNHELRLALNNKTSVRTISQGVDFCGFRIWATHKKLRKSTAQKMRRRLRYLQKAYAHGLVDFKTVNSSVQSYVGLMRHCDSYRLRQNVVGGLVLQLGGVWNSEDKGRR